MLAKLTTDQFLRRLSKLEAGILSVTTPDGKTRLFEGTHPGESASIEIRDWRVVSNMMRKGDIGFAEDYRAGHWDTPDLTALTTLGLRNRQALDTLVVGKKFERALSMFSYLLRLNTVNGSKNNIQAHYDLGNDFYSLWLDPGMSYSSALYKNEQEDLQAAQDNKYDRMIDSLGSSSGRLLEIGCGWGGFAQRAVQRGDFAIKGITLSEQQHKYAAQRLQYDADIALEDYRHQTGKFDHIVSIEMFEAVGEQYWKTYFEKLSSLLETKGKAVIQTITMNERDFPRYRKGGDFIRSFIFPGGMLPSESRFRQEAQNAGLKTKDAFFFGQDYARTLEEWLRNFDAKLPQVRALGFDDGFIRLWRFYLSACVAGFRTGRTNVMQVEVSHA